MIVMMIAIGIEIGIEEKTHMRVSLRNYYKFMNNKH